MTQQRIAGNTVTQAEADELALRDFLDFSGAAPLHMVRDALQRMIDRIESDDWRARAHRYGVMAYRDVTLDRYGARVETATVVADLHKTYSANWLFKVEAREDEPGIVNWTWQGKALARTLKKKIELLPERDWFGE